LAVSDEILATLGLKNIDMGKACRSIGVLFDSNTAKEFFSDGLVKKISSLHERAHPQLKINLANDWTAGFIDNCSIEENVLMRGFLLSMPCSKIGEVKESVLSDTKLIDCKAKRLSEISNAQKRLLGFSMLNHSNQDIIILDEWPVIIDSENNIDTSEALLRLFSSDRNLSIKLSIYEQSFGSETNELFHFTDNTLFYIDNSNAEIDLF